MVSKTIIIPRYAETDQMGVIHHSVYPIYFEQGRVNYCEELGFPFHEIESRGIGQAILNINLNYLFPARFGDKLTLETRLTTLTKIKTEFSYRLYNQDNVLLNEGTTLLVWLNKDFKPTNIAKSHPDIYEALVKCLEN
jgi:acyl-CoA thioester hydrolase